MLLVTFHGGPGSTSINNAYAYDTATGSLLTRQALGDPKHVKLDELRTMVVADGVLYVASGAKGASRVLCYTIPGSGASFTYASTLVTAELDSSGAFKTSISHPFGIAFDRQGHPYVSNQDTNVVARVGKHGKVGKGCRSDHLNRKYPPPGNTFLDGTFVASHKGQLPDVAVKAPDVHKHDGGLSVDFDAQGKAQNSVRDVAIANDILFVCDEPAGTVKLYAIADGTWLGTNSVTDAASGTLPDKPTHLQIFNGGLYVSAGTGLYWGALPASSDKPSLNLQAIAVPDAPAGNKIGGVSFGPPPGSSSAVATLYLVSQAGTGGADGGAIYTYAVAQKAASSPPALSNGSVFVASGLTTFQDTPEFVLYLA